MQRTLPLVSALVALILCFVSIPTASAAEKEQQPRTPAPANPELRTAMLARERVDQDVRRRYLAWVNKLQSEGAPLPENAPIIKEMRQTDHQTRKWLGEVVQQHGWPGRSLVGKDGAHAAWLLLQHCDHDLPFQQRCLTLMKTAPKGEVARHDIAYLEDRIRVNSGRKQLYGTQYLVENGRLVIRIGVEDPEHLDQRRHEAGLPPLEEERKKVQKLLEQPQC